MMAKIIGLNAQLMLPPFCVERGVNKLLARHFLIRWCFTRGLSGEFGQPLLMQRRGERRATINKELCGMFTTRRRDKE